MYRDKFFPLIGGVETHIANIVRHLPEYEFEILANAIPDEKLTENFGTNSMLKRFPPVDHTIVPFQNELLSKASFPYRVVTDIIRLNNKKRYLENADYDVLHIHSHDMCSNLLRIDRKLGSFILTNLIDFSYIKKPILFTFHGMYSELQGNDPMARLYDEKFIKVFDNIVVVEKYIEIYLKQFCEKNGLEKNIWFVPNSVDTYAFPYTPISKNDRLKVGYISRVDPVHGIGIISELSRNLPKSIELSIVIAGAMKEVNRIKKQFSGSNVTIETNLDSTGVKNFINKMNIILNPIEFQAISRVTLEAMACGRPVIMLDTGNRHPVIDGETGYLVRKKEEIFPLLEKLANNNAEIQRVGKNAREIIEKEFSNQAIMPKLNNIYESLFSK